jgi:hypothetical protein
VAVLVDREIRHVIVSLYEKFLTLSSHRPDQLWRERRRPMPFRLQSVLVQLGGVDRKSASVADVDEADRVIAAVYSELGIWAGNWDQRMKEF